MFLTMAMRNLIQAKRRTFLLALALAATSFILVMLLSLSSGLSRTITDTITTLSTGHINVTGFFKVRPTSSSPFIAKPDGVRDIIHKEFPDALVVERLMGWAKIVGESNSVTAEVAGIDRDHEPFLLKRLVLESSSSGKIADVGAPGTIALFASQAKKMGAQAGDSVTMMAETAGGAQNVLELRVAAILQDRGLLTNFLVITGHDTLRKLYSTTQNSIGAFLIYLPHESQTNGALQKLRDKLTAEQFKLMDYDPQPYFMKFEKVAAEDWVGQRFDLTTWRDYGSMMFWIVTAIDTITLVIIIVIFIIVSVGIFNSIWMSVRERTAEIGTMRALGMQKRQVLGLILTESTVLAVLSSCLGSGLGLSLAMALNFAHIPIHSEAMRSILLSDALTLDPSWAHMGVALALSLLTVTFSAMGPALRAAGIAPATAIRHGT